MFSQTVLDADLERFREETCPEALVLTTERDFEVMPQDWLYELALVTDDIRTGVDPVDPSWVPEDAPSIAHRLADGDPLIGLPGDGSLTRTRTTEPPLVILKPRSETVPDTFRRFLIAEALVDLGADHPDHALAFFKETYPRFDAVVDNEPVATYQLAVALFAAWRGLNNRTVFRNWAEPFPSLHAAWQDAGDRLRDRLETLPEALARGDLTFPTATELAANGIKHDLELPAPFAAFDVSAYRQEGPEFAIRWAENVLTDR